MPANQSEGKLEINGSSYDLINAKISLALNKGYQAYLVSDGIIDARHQNHLVKIHLHTNSNSLILWGKIKNIESRISLPFLSKLELIDPFSLAINSLKYFHIQATCLYQLFEHYFKIYPLPTYMNYQILFTNRRISSPISTGNFSGLDFFHYLIERFSLFYQICNHENGITIEIFSELNQLSSNTISLSSNEFNIKYVLEENQSPKISKSISLYANNENVMPGDTIKINKENYYLEKSLIQVNQKQINNRSTKKINQKLTLMPLPAKIRKEHLFEDSYKVLEICSPLSSRKKTNYDVSMKTPFSENSRFLKFNLSYATEILTGTVNFNHKPILIGALTNTENLEVVTRKNKLQHCLITQSGNYFIIDESKQKQISLYNGQSQDQYLHMKEITGQFLVGSKTGELTVSCANNYQLSSNDICLDSKEKFTCSLLDNYYLNTHYGYYKLKTNGTINSFIEKTCSLKSKKMQIVSQNSLIEGQSQIEIKVKNLCLNSSEINTLLAQKKITIVAQNNVNLSTPQSLLTMNQEQIQLKTTKLVLNSSSFYGISPSTWLNGN